ncbi:16S rRNA (uracil(1498)-N(3))-methyltransferase [Piscinibacter terrae]|uniref:Ribosomal RNA small subunit methyltransferase E n=1 Tax=Piscinibacter terrae TaxID=2496871 RepID=A0A3N7HUD1_9BURK|nr:16S rRNA (uracil(1498)-N(3))-methyltransferase [Albitalea terrae]RQP24531.1 16S rRNA (uracil(1498)-N(3))-methyltransferase [Albitalea terrae]
MPRLFVDLPLHENAELTLPPGPARHVQVLRMQPGDTLTCFNGAGGEWTAEVLRMGRQDVEVRIGAHDAVDRELLVKVTLAVGMPANDRMDFLVEKATELGVHAIQPLVCERSVLRLSGERALKKVEHWKGVAVAAAEQSGRTRVPAIEPVLALPAWLAGHRCDAQRWLLSFLRSATSLGHAAPAHDVVFVSGPEGGLSPAEEGLAQHAGFAPVTLGPRVLRADTAPLAALSFLALQHR